MALYILVCVQEMDEVRSKVRASLFWTNKGFVREWESRIAVVKEDYGKSKSKLEAAGR